MFEMLDLHFAVTRATWAAGPHPDFARVAFDLDLNAGDMMEVVELPGGPVGAGSAPEYAQSTNSASRDGDFIRTSQRL